MANELGPLKIVLHTASSAELLIRLIIRVTICKYQVHVLLLRIHVHAVYFVHFQPFISEVSLLIIV